MSRRQLTGGILIAGLCAIGAIAAAQTTGQPIRMTAWAVNMSNIATGANATIDIRVDRWSTPQEREQLITTFLNKGQDALLRALQKAPVKGRMRIPGYMGPDPHNYRLGWDLRYAWEFPGEDGGRRIVIATDRYIGFWEARNQPRTVDYPFTFIEIRLNPDGKGEGKLAAATKLTFDRKKNTVELENYSTEPVRLQNVRVEKKGN